MRSPHSISSQKNLCLIQQDFIRDGNAISLLSNF